MFFPQRPKKMTNIELLEAYARFELQLRTEEVTVDKKRTVRAAMQRIRQQLAEYLGIPYRIV